jgi:hypothetical protein
LGAAVNPGAVFFYDAKISPGIAMERAKAVPGECRNALQNSFHGRHSRPFDSGLGDRALIVESFE